MTLALFGGQPVRTRPFPPHVTTGKEERDAVLEVLDSGLLSGFAARTDHEFLGGPKVLALEEAFCERFKIGHAVAFNSATSALHAAVAAAGVGPGDEVITSPYTMSASASCILAQGGTPVFADVEPETFCIDPAAVERAITSRTKVLLPVNLFGQPAALAPLLDLAKRYRLVVIEDNAQAPGALYQGCPTGTLGHMGIFSLNRHKAIQCGEGGVVVTDDRVFAHRLQLMRNHGEVLAEELGWPEDAELVGQNYRMTELQAAVAVAQMDKLDEFNRQRADLAEQLTRGLADYSFLVPPKTREGCAHVYYLYVMLYKSELLGVSRATLLKALSAEGIPVQAGYVKPLYRLRLYSKRALQPAPCHVVDKLYEETLLTTNVCRYPATPDDMDDVIRAIDKIAEHRRALLDYERLVQASAQK